MADEELISIGAQDNFSSVLDKAADAAENFAKRVNAAFSTIKPGEAKEKIDKLGEGIAQAGEKAGSAAKAIGSQFGEGGRILGEIAEAAVQSIAGIGTAFVSLRGKGADAAKEVDHFAESAAKAEKAAAATAGGGGLLSSLGGIGGRLGLLGGGAAALGIAGVGAAGFGLEQSEALVKMSQAAGTSLEEFLKLIDASKQFGLSIQETAGLFTSVRNGIHESAIASREITDQWQIMQERVSLINDRIRQGTIERAEAEHGAADQARDDQHSIEQAAQHLADVQEQNRRAQSADAKSLAAHGGIARTINEQAEARRQEGYERERQNRAEIEAARSLGEAQHKAADDVRKADEERSSRNLQATREQTLLDRFSARERIEAINIEQRSPPQLRALLAEGRQQGIADLSKNLERARDELNKLDAGPVEEAFRRIERAIDRLPDGAEKTRLLNANFGEVAAKIKESGKEISEALSPEAFEKFKSSLSAHDVEEMAQRMNKLTGNLVTITEVAIKAGTGVSSAFDKIGKGVSNAFGPIRDALVKLDDIFNASKRNRGPGEQRQQIDEVKKAQEDKASTVVETSKEEVKAIDSVTGALRNQASVASAARAPSTGAQSSTGSLFGLGGMSSADLRTFGPAKIVDLLTRGENVRVAPAGGAAAQGISSAESASSAFADKLQRAGSSVEQFAQKLMETIKPNFAERFGGEAGAQPMRQGTVDRASQEDIEAATKSAAALGDVASGADKAASAFEDFARRIFGGGEGRARGGPVSGPGGPTSDSVPIMASSGEYVINARQTAKHYSLVKAINDDRLGGFAFGGLVFDLPRFAGGGDVAGPSRGEALHPVTIKMPGGESIEGFHGSPSAIEAMSRYAVMRQAASTAKRKPTWVR